MKRTTKNLIILVFMLMFITYLFSPNGIIVKALEKGAVEGMERVLGSITSSGPDNPLDSIVKKHLGYGVLTTGTYDSSCDNGFKTDEKMQAWLDTHMNNADDFTYGWFYSLEKNTSIFCQQHHQPLPSPYGKFLERFHGDGTAAHACHTGDADTNSCHKNVDTKNDYVERFFYDDETVRANQCQRHLVLEVDNPRDELEPETHDVHEYDVAWGMEYIQHTKVRLEYKKQKKIFSMGQAYIFSYSERKIYKNDRAQLATWGYVNGITGDDAYCDTPLYRSAVAIDDVYGLPKNPTTTPVANPIKPVVSKGTQTGTVLSGSNYKIGPISMSNYTFAWCESAADFSGELLCGIKDAVVEFDNGKSMTLGASNFEFTPTAQDRSGSYWRAPKSTDGYFYPTPGCDFYILIPVAQSEVIGATTLDKLTITYKWTTADGDGWDLIGTYVDLEWTSTRGFSSSCTYDCDECYHDGLSFSERSATSSGVNKTSHAYWCNNSGASQSYCSYGTNGSHRHCKDDTHASYGTCATCPGHASTTLSTACPGICTSAHHSSTCPTGACTTQHPHLDTCPEGCTDKHHSSTCPTAACSTQHSHLPTCHTSHTAWSSASSPGCYETSYCAYATLDYCEHGHQYGKHDNSDTCTANWGTDHIDKCYGTENVGTKCSHGHTTCYDLTWKCTDENVVDAQKLIGVREAQVHERTVETSISNIPIVAKVELNKYIYDVEHNVAYSGHDSTMSASDGRKELDEGTKEANPVYAEYGDKVTFKICLKNYSAFAVRVRVKDILPADSTLISAEMGSTSITDLDAIKNQILVVPAAAEADEDGNVASEIWFKVIVMVESIDTTKLYNNMATIITRNGDNKINTSIGEEDVDRLRVNDDDYGPVVNHESVTCNGTTNEPVVTSRDFYKVNDYSLTIDKYISDYDQTMRTQNNTNGFTNEPEVVITDRYGMSEDDKKNRPLQAEKTEKVTYSIRLTNDMQARSSSVTGAEKKATCVRPTEIKDIFQTGLKFESVTAKIYKSDGTEKGDVTIGYEDIGNNSYKFTIPEPSETDLMILDPGEYIIFYVVAEITESNMYLLSLENYSTMTILTNINHLGEYEREVKNDTVDRNTSTQKESRDYVKLKDLVIAGRVWLDRDKDGYMGKDANGNLEVGGNAINVESSPAPYADLIDATEADKDKEYAMQGIVVNLYKVGEDEPYRTTKTDSNGLFTFARQANGSTWRDGVYSYDGSVTESDQRVPKAEPKDNNTKNYSEDSQHIQYYIEYQYDGIAYKSTEIYSNQQHLHDDKSGEFDDEYKIDSNALELVDARENFNREYEIIAFDSAYDSSLLRKKTLEYDNEVVAHESRLLEDNTRYVTARSFITEGAKSTDTSHTDFLWLFPQSTYNKPETEYLKYINLGLEEREDVDMSITQDVYELKTTINGEEMLYEMNQNNYTLQNGEITSSNVGNPEAKRKTIDKDQASTGSTAFDSERFFTGYSNDSSTTMELYQFEYYLEDYNYRVSQYHIDTVRGYKGSPVRDYTKPVIDTGTSVITDNTGTAMAIDGATVDSRATGRESELNTEITFRIKVTNHTITNDEPHQTDSDKKVYAGVNEIVEYYDEEFVDVVANGDGSVNGFFIKTKDANGYLVDTEMKVAKAKAYLTDDSSGQKVEKDVILSTTSPYNTARTVGGFDTLFIRPASATDSNRAGDFILAEGESMDVLITFIVEKEIDDASEFEMQTIGGRKLAIAEISAYSIYHKEDSTYKAAALVDRDSNPGNFGETYGGITEPNSSGYIKYIEDDTFKTGINLIVADPNHGRTLDGFVWDDARTNSATDNNGTQYIGNGTYSTSDNAHDVPSRKNQIFDVVSGDVIVSNKEDNDFRVEDVKVELIELIKMPDPAIAGGERIYQDTIYVNGNLETDPTLVDASIMKQRTNSNGEYKFVNYIPGEYIVKFTYGDLEDNGTSSDNRLIFNGQDYKSTTYQSSETVYAENATGSGDKTADDVRLEILEKANISDAKDDEIRRLEVIGYSETMNNARNEVLKGAKTSDKDELLGRTYMSAETTDFLVRAEKEISRVTKLSYEEYTHKIVRFDPNAADRFMIHNIDFGLQYRPELQVALNKYISNISVTTSDSHGANSAEPIVDAIFEPYYGVVRKTDIATGATSFIKDNNPTNPQVIEVKPDMEQAEIASVVSSKGGNISEAEISADGKYVLAIAGTRLNLDKSVGLQNVQYLESEYYSQADGTPELEHITENGEDKWLVKADQGFAYIVIDDDIAQGATIKVKYLFTGTNISEIDRVATNLSGLRFKENGESAKYAKLPNSTDPYYGEVSYQLEAADKKPGFYDVNYSAARTARNALFSEFYRYELDAAKQKRIDDLGREIVYRIKAKDLTVTGKKVEIPNIIRDTNATTGTPHTGNTGYYGRYLGSTYYTGIINSDKEVVAELKLDKILDYIDNDLVFSNNDNNTENELWKTTTSSQLKEEGLVSLKVFKNIPNTSVGSIDAPSGYKLVDAKGRAYDTNQRSNLALSLDDRVRDDYGPGETDTSVNKSFSKFLLPRESKSLESFGSISLTAAKVLSPEDETDDMVYENVAEIIQYTSVTGRVTNLATTIGNAQIEDITGESPEFRQGRTESDTASVEKITLTPPTGLNRTQHIVREVVESASYTVFVIIGVVAICVAVMAGINIYHRKRRIK